MEESAKRLKEYENELDAHYGPFAPLSEELKNQLESRRAKYQNRLEVYHGLPVLSSEALQRQLACCLEEYENEFEAYHEFCVRLEPSLSWIREYLSSELDIAYRNYKDITRFLDNSEFERLMLEYVVLLERLRDRVLLDILSIGYPLLSRLEKSRQSEFCTTRRDLKQSLKAEFLTAHKHLSFEIGEYARRGFLADFLSTLEVLPNVVAGRRLKHWEIFAITNRSRTPIPLRDFLKKFCGVAEPIRLRAISQRINQAAGRTQIQLPEPVDIRTRGSIKIFYYNPADLLKAWGEFGEKLGWLPELI
ncbi:MAG: hypothetical protein ACYS0H_30920 [Planctomycetota bacterium]